MTHTRVFFSGPRHQSTVTKKKVFVSRNRAINKLVPPRDDNRKIPRNDIALLRHARVGEGLLYRKSTPRGVPHDHLLRTKRTERARCASLTAQIGREERKRKRRRNARVNYLSRITRSSTRAGSHASRRTRNGIFEK